MIPDIFTVMTWVEAIRRLSPHSANDAFNELCRVLNDATLEEWAAAFTRDVPSERGSL